MNAAATTIRYSGPKTISHIAAHSRRRAEQVVAEIRYHATNPEYDIEDPARLLFGQYVEDELLRRYGKGIASISERVNCPLMWSHYGDQHKGVYYSIHNHSNTGAPSGRRPFRKRFAYTSHQLRSPSEPLSGQGADSIQKDTRCLAVIFIVVEYTCSNLEIARSNPLIEPFNRRCT